MFVTDDLSLAAYLTAIRGLPILEMTTNNRYTNFHFEPEAENHARDWKLNPDEVMDAIQRYTYEREKLFKVVRDERFNNDRRNK